MAPPTTLALEGPISVLAQDNSGVLPRSFLLAVVLVAPLALWQWWRIRQRREKSQAIEKSLESEHTEPSPQPDQPGTTLEALVTEIGRLGRDLGSEQTETLRIPLDITLGGRATDRSVVDRLVADALARSGLDATESTDVNGDRVLECRRR